MVYSTPCMLHVTAYFNAPPPYTLHQSTWMSTKSLIQGMVGKSVLAWRQCTNGLLWRLSEQRGSIASDQAWLHGNISVHFYWWPCSRLFWCSCGWLFWSSCGWLLWCSCGWLLWCSWNQFICEKIGKNILHINSQRKVDLHLRWLAFL